MRHPHAIPRNEQCRTPKRFVALSCESKAEVRGTGFVRTFKSATIIESARSDTSGCWSEPVELTFDSPESLWEEIMDYTRVRARTWLVGWKLGDELRIAQAFKWMKAWTVNPDVIISDTTLSVGWHDEAGRSLLAVDLLSYVPTDLVKLRSLTGTFSDAQTIFKAFMDLVCLQHDFDLGNFSRTGASNASNMFRHTSMQERIYIHDDAQALEAERASVFTGRTEAWRHGPFRDLDEWDLPLAYARVGLDTSLPVRLLGLRTGGGPPRCGTFLGLAHVRCAVPVLPCRSGGPGGQEGSGPITWPVGSFSGWYWREELELAAEHGATYDVERCYEYATAPVLASWAEWIIASQRAGDLTGVQQLAAKHWGRALIGKMGSRVPQWTSDAIFEGTELELSKEVDDRYGIGERLTIGGRSLVSFKKAYGDNAFPALMSRVVSECRIRLFRLMDVAGLEHVFYVDTDSLFTDREGSSRLGAFVSSGGGWGVRVKHHHYKVTIHGPRQLIERAGPRVSGLPKVAKRSGLSDRYVAQMTEGFKAGAGSGHAGEVVSTERSFKLKPSDRRRIQLEDGTTEARSA
jgi:hypothetical protein